MTSQFLCCSNSSNVLDCVFICFGRGVVWMAVEQIQNGTGVYLKHYKANDLSDCQSVVKKCLI